MQTETTTDERDRLWDENPERAARLAYAELMCHWHEQVVTGKYQGVPCLHRSTDSRMTERRPLRYTPDPRADVYEVPYAVIDQWKSAA